MEIKRGNFFKLCKDDHDRLCNLLMEAGEVSVSQDIMGVVKTDGRVYSVYLYKIGGKEYRVSKKLHMFLVEHGCILESEEAHEAK